ncbi:hypothetical protein [Nocardiopsis salina]|uniref:hypothetical protein n=1 Tax=Nocardiopsis salina TaxID=245836 RepID=UPI000476F5A0|nr:hypothetical protein [Nocardiopsis salina]
MRTQQCSRTPAQRALRWCVLSTLAGCAAMWVALFGDLVAGADAAWVWAEQDPPVEGPDESAEESTTRIRAVVNRVRLVLIAIASALGTLFLTIAGVRWLVANGEPGAVDGAKRALTGASLGYGIAILATVLMEILDWIISAGGDGT